MEAIEVLEQLPPGPELAMAYSNMAQLKMLSEEGQEALQWGGRALDLAERFDLMEVLAHALNNIGTAELAMGMAEGTANLERSLALALKHGMHDHAARAYTNLSFAALSVRDYALAQARLAEGLAYTRERDLDYATLYQLALRSCVHLEQGFWQEAEDDAGAVLRAGGAIVRIMATAVLSCVRLRKGDPDAQILLDQTRKLALRPRDITWIALMAAARAEAAWLKGNKKQLHDEVQPAYELALEHPDPWRLGELSLWMWRAGALDDPPERIASPYRLEISGDWQGAAAAWRKIGCPYERALALASGDRPAQFEALRILDGLGAAPAAAIVRRNLRTERIRSIPLGPRAL
jgi:hypothetical protein